MRATRGVLRAAAAVLLVLAGCGGGSSGGVYKGTTDPAEIGLADADLLTKAVATDYGFDLTSLAHFAKPGGGAAPMPARLLGLALVHRDARLLPKAADGARRSVKLNQDCPSGGTVTLEVPSLTAATGTFRETFHQCDLGGGFLLNGPVTDTVTTSTATKEIGTARLDLSVELGGEAFRFAGSTGYNLNSGTLRNHTTGDFEFWDAAGDLGFRIRDQDTTSGYANLTDWNDDCPLSDDYTMNVADSLFGAVDVATGSAVTYTGNKCTNPGPASGGPIVLTGARGGTIPLAPLSTSQVSFAVDLEGDAVPERTTTELWTDLGFD